VAKSIKQKDNIGMKQSPNNQTTTNQAMEWISKAGFTNLATAQLNILNT
jgi:hypothetical protein